MQYDKASPQLDIFYKHTKRALIMAQPAPFAPRGSEIRVMLPSPAAMQGCRVRQQAAPHGAKRTKRRNATIPAAGCQNLTEH